MPFAPVYSPRQKPYAPVETNDRRDAMVGAQAQAEAGMTFGAGVREGTNEAGTMPEFRPMDEEVTAAATLAVRMGNTRPQEQAENRPIQAGNVHAQVLRPVRGAHVAGQDMPPVPIGVMQRIRRNFPQQPWDAGTEI